ncbi:ester hydrolase C11orf54-like protein [Elysia marginata]|uniref:Ester hydrolase C11orf54-like protein n=1 Tax=Elysia marginata TaxID=1093978 RepID=A0AAV4FHN6_9GAST|nr:ester hydrolase C11orf54-like protein [Elysia marginata]
MAELGRCFAQETVECIWLCELLRCLVEKQYFYAWRCKAPRELEAHFARMFAHLSPFYCGKNWPNLITVRDSTPHHQRCSTPPVVFTNAICLVSLTSSSPYTYTAISMVNAELRFVNEYDTSPLDAIPRGMFLGPWRTLVSVTLGQDGADVWATSTTILVSPHENTTPLVSLHENTTTLVSPHENTTLLVSLYENTTLLVSPHENTTLLVSPHENTTPLVSLHESTALLVSLHENTTLLVSPHENTSLLVSLHENTTLLVSLHENTTLLLESIHEDTTTAFTEVLSGVRKASGEEGQGKDGERSTGKNERSNATNRVFPKFTSSTISTGLCGQPRLADIGGVDHLKPFPRRDKNYEIKKICDLCEMPNGGLVIGAGAGPNHVFGWNCELICNARLGGEEPCDKTKISRVQDDGSYLQLESNSGKFSLMGNFLISEGKPGKVLEVKVSHRTGKQNFVGCLHDTLAQHYGDSKGVGLGGTFLLKTGKANIHVMPEFLKEAMETDEQTHNWLKFYDMDAPLVHVGEVVSADPQGLHLRQEHFHCFSEHGQAGHYHFDTTPETASYLGYFNVAEAVYRIDLPTDTKYLF